jgi:polysaccharide export outer membrane protein
LLIACALVAGCERRGGHIPYDPPGFTAPDAPSAAAIEAYDIRLGPLDVVRINFFRIPELSNDYQIDAHGNIDLPLIGQVKARDLSTDDFTREIEQRYGARYLNNPDISVRVLTSNQANVTVEGAVNAPGIYPLQGRTTLIGAIAMGRGTLLYDSNPKRVAIFRKREGKTVAAAFDLVAIRHGEMADPVVYPGDTIVVDGSSIRTLYRDLLQTIPLIAVFNSL